jgi:DNA helicase-2/ATP-dependent DNA helicase PcrA
VESLFEPLPLIEPDDLPGMEDAEIDDEQDLGALKEAFLRTSYADRTPFRVEAPFQLSLGGRLVRGRIDAVYRDDDGGYEVVDWKTSRGRTADPLQLAVYRLAWAEQLGIAPERVDAAFLYVRTGEVVRPRGLPDREGLERILVG